MAFESVLALMISFGMLVAFIMSDIVKLHSMGVFSFPLNVS